MAVVDTLEDVFDEEADIDVVNRREWGKIANDLKKGGYREGLAAGQENMVQSGFNTGYMQAVSISEMLGHLRGQLSAHLSWTALQNKDNNSALKDKNVDIESLLKNISQFEQDLVVMVTQEEALAESKSTETSNKGHMTTQGRYSDETTESCGDNSREHTCSPRETTATPSESISRSDRLFKETFEHILNEAQAKYDQFALDVVRLLN